MITIEEAAKSDKSTIGEGIQSDSELTTRITLAAMADDDYREQMFTQVIDALNEITMTDLPVEVTVSRDSLMLRRLPYWDA
jgi:hypothetical protein